MGTADGSADTAMGGCPPESGRLHAPISKLSGEAPMSAKALLRSMRDASDMAPSKSVAHQGEPGDLLASNVGAAGIRLRII